MRRLVADGAPSENLVGTDLVGEFLSLGYDLFRDRATLNARFIAADFFASGGELDALKGRVDIVQANSFFHLFDRETQTTVARKVVGFLRAGREGLVVGRQVGDARAGEMVHPVHKETRMFLHNEESWREMWEGVAEEMGRRVEVSSRMESAEDWFANHDAGDENKRKLIFTVRIV